jgi:hypothetical protein
MFFTTVRLGESKIKALIMLAACDHFSHFDIFWRDKASLKLTLWQLPVHPVKTTIVVKGTLLINR